MQEPCPTQSLPLRTSGISLGQEPFLQEEPPQAGGPGKAAQAGRISLTECSSDPAPTELCPGETMVNMLARSCPQFIRGDRPNKHVHK